ncbi:oxygen-insensitive NADPH nitroreductase [Fictibacillus phosphorivorans]|uniref:oxygen-insensitive NADPH nitroreductase n=1 Tax=Fictibacillus phosphorivorans TaxID=1221500 RepID=UPI00203D1227|nr:oxygen-insensitive NADPH nitroreductase [Fictibacillus phosphorivorans]MCM3718803.1 oxygen-insensitive NADPH nitroreductase [Fictibacillus phosphorivorans]MCM3776426.1 oxygen-insensitive NADPH nitroreductase [Fictibacillus phosphorivorans]
MNEVIETILAHRSIRRFKDKTISEETITTLVECAQAASTSSYQQVCTIIGVEEQEKKQKLAELAGNQSYVAENGYFFVFCLDYNRHKIAAEMKDKDISETIQSTEAFIVGTVDASLAAQNVAVAAESLGLGIVYIGGIRNNLKEVSELLGCPEYVLPLFGMAIGYPDATPGKKPRLPLGAVFHKNGYKDNEEAKSLLEQYESETAKYYTKRTGGRRTEGWVTQITTSMASPKRAYMKDFVRKKGLNKT